MAGERVIVRQDRTFETEFLAFDPPGSPAAESHSIVHPQELTPYGMLLASLGACTAIVLHTYARHHELSLDRVELRLRYDRIFAKDCEDCEKTNPYEDVVDLEIALAGKLDSEDSERLLLVSQHCPIHKMLARGIPVRSHLAPGSA